MREKEGGVVEFSPLRTIYIDLLSYSALVVDNLLMKSLTGRLTPFVQIWYKQLLPMLMVLCHVQHSSTMRWGIRATPLFFLNPLPFVQSSLFQYASSKCLSRISMDWLPSESPWPCFYHLLQK